MSVTKETYSASRMTSRKSSRGGLLALTFAFAVLVDLTSTNAGLSHSRAQNRNLQRVIRHDTIVLVLQGVRERALNSVEPDPILLINFPEVDHQFKVNASQF